MTTDLWMIWLAVAIVLVIAEIFTSSAIALCMSVGSLGAFVSALAGCSIEIQLLVLALSMLASLIFIPPLMRRYKGMFRTGKEASSNMDALIGRTATVEHPTACTTETTPRIRIDGDRWQIRTADGSPISAGDRVEVCGYDSIILIVNKI